MSGVCRQLVFASAREAEWLQMITDQFYFCYCPALLDYASTESWLIDKVGFYHSCYSHSTEALSPRTTAKEKPHLNSSRCYCRWSELVYRCRPQPQKCYCISTAKEKIIILTYRYWNEIDLQNSGSYIRNPNQTAILAHPYFSLSLPIYHWS